MAHSQKKLTEISPKEGKTSDLLDKGFELTVLSILKGLEKTMDKELK